MTKTAKAKTKANKWHTCGCAITMREMLKRVNAQRLLSGKRHMSLQRFYALRLSAAEAFLEKFPHGNKGMDRNPFLPDRMVGCNYIFSAKRAPALMKVAAAVEVRGSKLNSGEAYIPQIKEYVTF
jgi:hypothetical protein